MQQGVQINNLLDRVRRAGLLAVPKRRVSDVKLWRGVKLLDLSIKNNLRHCVIRKNVPKQIWLWNVLQRVVMHASIL